MKKHVKVLSLMLLSVFILGIVGCGGDTNSPKGTVEKFVDSVKKLDTEALKTTVTKTEELGDLNNVSADEKETLTLMFSALEASDLTEKIDGETAEVTGKITTLDFDQVFSLLLDALADVENEAEMEKKFAEEMKKIVADKNTPKITKNVSFKLKKVDSKWLIDTEATDMDEVLAAFMPGMM